MSQNLQEQLDYLRSIATGVVVDAMELLGIKGWTRSIFPLNHEDKIVGPAVVALFTPAVSDYENVLNQYEIIDSCEPGDVLIFAGAPEGRILGGNLGFSAKNRGLAGMVLDGKTRDVNELIENSVPIFCRGAAIGPTASEYKFTLKDVPVNCDGAMIRPGDIIIGDVDGIAVVPVGMLDKLIYQCRHVADVEQAMSQALREKRPASETKEILKQKKIPKP